MVKQQELRVNTKTPVKRKMTARSYEYLYIISVNVVTMICLSLNSFNSNPESTTERKKKTLGLFSFPNQDGARGKHICRGLQETFLSKEGLDTILQNTFPLRRERFYNDLNSLFLCLIFEKYT